MPSIPRSLVRARAGGGSALARIAVLAAANIPHLHSRPTIAALDTVLGKPQENPGSGSFWMNVGIAVALVALGGIFAGLTLGCVSFFFFFPSFFLFLSFFFTFLSFFLLP